MAYIVMALGLLMSVVGLAAIATGYPIIEVERGWATVISGSVLLSGGLVTAALGIVLRSLLSLKDALRAPAVPTYLEEARAFEPEEPAYPLDTPEYHRDVPSSPSVATNPPAAHAPASDKATPALAVAVPAAAALVGETLHRRDAPVSDVPDAAAPTAPTAHEPVDDAPEAPAQETPAPVFEAPDVSGDQYEPHIPAAAEHNISAHAEPETHPSNPDEAWLDQAFSAFDYEMAAHQTPAAEPPMVPASEPGLPPEHEVHAQQDAPPEPEVHPADDEPAAHHDVPEPAAAPHQGGHHEAHAVAAADQSAPAEAREPRADEAPATAPDAPPSNLTVIGRYDSEGTAYVMYSDGSIEAQSEAGVYRFGSMAELKAFIEG